MNQHELFLQGEADAWFARNRAVLTPERVVEKDPVFELIERIGLAAADEVLEIGAANGYRLAALHRRFGCAVTAVEPSQQAIEDGRLRFPEIQYIQGLAHHLPELEDGSFDLVLVNFVLHWVDRAMLLRTAAEIDRVLKDGGHLIVGDFFPDEPQRVKYHHRPDADVWTYKQDYSRLWLTANTYEEIDSLVFDYDTRAIHAAAEPSNRGKVSLLRKRLKEQYQIAVRC